MHELRIHRAGALLHRTEHREEHRKIRGAEICTDLTFALGANDQLLDQRDELRTHAQQARLVLRAAVEQLSDGHGVADPAHHGAQEAEEPITGIVVIGRPAEVISASANNAATGQILQRVGGQLGEQTGMHVTQTDLIPFSENDPNGAGLGVLSFPMVMGGLAGGIVIGLQVIGGGRKIVAVLVYGVLAGFAVTALGGPLLDVFQREFELTWLAVGLAFAAMSATVAGLVTLLRTPGIPVAALLFMFFANPISGTNSPKEFLPGPWGEIGQYLPPGAISTLIRDISYFPEADTTMQWLVLSGWLALGLVLIGIGLAWERGAVRRSGGSKAAVQDTSIDYSSGSAPAAAQSGRHAAR